MAGKKEIVSAGAPKAIGPYSAGMSAGDLVFCSGQIGIDPRSGEIAKDIAGQTSGALKNLEAVLGSAGLGMESVVKTTVFMTDLSEFQQMNEVYARHFRQPYPARSTVQVAALPRGAKVEIECIAARV